MFTDEVKNTNYIYKSKVALQHSQYSASQITGKHLRLKHLEASMFDILPAPKSWKIIGQAHWNHQKSMQMLLGTIQKASWGAPGVPICNTMHPREGAFLTRLFYEIGAFRRPRNPNLVPGGIQN